MPSRRTVVVDPVCLLRSKLIDLLSLLLLLHILYARSTSSRAFGYHPRVDYDPRVCRVRHF
jgi:hypothetical protein